MSSDISDAKCMRAMYMIFGGLFGVFAALVVVARLVTG
jgi:hypothetical protein